MTLRDYLSQQGQTLASFAAEIGEHPRAARNWYYGVRQPPLIVVAKIETATAGAVALADWLPNAV